MTKRATAVKVDLNNYKSLFVLEDLNFSDSSAYYEERVIWTTKEDPDSIGFAGGLFYNVPNYLFMAELLMDDVTWSRLFIRLHD